MSLFDFRGATNKPTSSLLFHYPSKKSKHNHHYFDIIRLGLASLLFVAGICINFDADSTKVTNSNVIFQAILDDDVTVSRNLTASSSSFRSSSSHNSNRGTNQDYAKFGLNGYDTNIATFNTDERRQSLIWLGSKCLPNIDPTSEKRLYIHRFMTTNTNAHSVLEKYDEISTVARMKFNKGDMKSYTHLLAIQMELWKFCIIGSGFASTFIDDQDGIHYLDSIQSIFELDEARYTNFVVVGPSASAEANAENKIDNKSVPFVNSSLLSLRSNEGIDLAKSIVATILLSSVDILYAPSQNGQWLSQTLSHHFHKAVQRNPNKFTLLRFNCNGLQDSSTSQKSKECTISGHSPCCQITKMKNNIEEVVMFMQHPYTFAHLLYGEAQQQQKQMETEKELLHSTIEVIKVQDEVLPLKNSRTFDIFLQNNCLPSWECQVCIIKKRPEDDTRIPCEACILECKCYCENICRIRPPNKPITRRMVIHPPRKRKDYDRLIPRLVHQTYFETVTKEKYPNFSRLVESWKNSGWEYNFYDDEASIKFLEEHNFAPEVLEAYKNILPGAYKADLFRLCVLLVHGGLYSDVDVELTADLDSLLEGDIGLVIPVDEPGRESGHGSCMWNGLIASVPGHPIIARAIQLIVNQIQNRFTVVDIDNMLCPGVVLDHSHAWDLLYITGPCIIGAAINELLGKHMQSEIIPGILNTTSAVNQIPGRTIILDQNKQDMGWHRFTWLEKNIIVAGTDCPDYDDRNDQKHYSYKPPAIKRALFGTKNIYKDFHPKSEDIEIIVV